jgi:hypothetical protein
MQEATFNPTMTMRRAKVALHRSCPNSKVTTLLPTDPDIAKFISPTPLRQIIVWQNQYGEDFWLWFITPEDDDGKTSLAKDLARDVLIDILKIKLVDENGRLCVDPDTAKLVQKAAESVLTKGTPMIAIQNNTVGMPQQEIPRGLKNKSPLQIRERMNTITKHVPKSQEPVGYIEGEIDDNDQCS